MHCPAAFGRAEMCFLPVEYDPEPHPRKVANCDGLPAPQELWLAGWVLYYSISSRHLTNASAQPILWLQRSFCLDEGIDFRLVGPVKIQCFLHLRYYQVIVAGNFCR
jgi:hypothetical protein